MVSESLVSLLAPESLVTLDALLLPEAWWVGLLLREREPADDGGPGGMEAGGESERDCGYQAGCWICTLSWQGSESASPSRGDSASGCEDGCIRSTR